MAGRAGRQRLDAQLYAGLSMLPEIYGGSELHRSVLHRRRDARAPSVAGAVGRSVVGGIDLNKPRLRHVAEAVIALSASPDGFTASTLAAQVRALGNPSAYGPRQAAYDLKKLRGKSIVRRIDSTRRYETLPSGLRAITALLVLRDKAIKPLLAAAQEITPTHGGQNPRTIDRHYHDLRLAMHGVFHELGIAA